MRVQVLAVLPRMEPPSCLTWKVHYKHAAACCAILHANAPALRFGRELAEGKAEPRRLVSGRAAQSLSAEGLEDPRPPVGRNSRTFVVDRERGLGGKGRDNDANRPPDLRVLHGV